MSEFLRVLQNMGFTPAQQVQDVRERRYHKAQSVVTRRWIVTVGGTTGNTTWLFAPTGQYIQHTETS